MPKFSHYMAIEFEGRVSLVAVDPSQPDRLYWSDGMGYMYRTPEIGILKQYPLSHDYSYEDEEEIELRFYLEYYGQDPDVPGPTGWLSPDGKFFKCRYGEHCSAAKPLAARYYGTIERPDTLLTRNGWIHIQEGRIFVSESQQATQAQIDVLFDLSKKETEYKRMFERALRRVTKDV
jgi:hypothetical protein